MNPYALLRPVKTDKPDRSVVRIINNINLEDLTFLIDSMDNLIAVDIETNGNKVHNPDTYVVGVGLADSSKILYFNVIDNLDLYHNLLVLLKDKQLLGFNINFDAAYFHRDYSAFLNQPVSGYGLKWHDWQYDVYALYKQLSNEGWLGQEWNLKSAQMDLLGWDSKGDIELTQWLIDNNHMTSVSLEPKKDYAFNIELNRWCRPDKSKMHLAPESILGYYCGLDAASTYMLLTEVFNPCVLSLPKTAQDLFWFYHTELFITNAKWHIEQQLRGIKINKDNLIKYTELLSKEIQKAETDFLTHPKVSVFVKEFNSMTALALLGKEPAKLTKTGKESKNYINWLIKKERLQSENHFNMNSGKQRQWLFYEKFKYPVILTTENGNPAVDKKALLAWGDVGQILKKNNDLVKELSYVQSCIEQLDMNKTGLLHPQYRLPGTLTCRIAGAGKFNIQQQPKSKGYLKEWVPSDKDYVWIDADVESLEAVVLAELSKDKTMRYLYDPSSPRNDIYLYVGAFLPGIKERILSAGYNPDHPTPEGIANAKKLAKHERQIAKTCVLGFQYGMGPKKLKQSLALEGIKMTDNEAFNIYKAYWDLFGGIKDFNKHLEAEWRKRGGWVYNGIGRPVTCNEMFLRDINNRVVQSTGHDILMYVNYQLYLLREQQGLDFWPIIIDWHDASLIECDKKDSDVIMNLFKTAYERLNDWLKGDLLIRTKPQITHNLAESKCE